MSQFANRLVLLLTQLAINVLALVVVDAIFDGVKLTGAETLIAAAVLLAVVNTYVRPVLLVLTLPVTILTLGLFTLVINALMLRLVAWLLPAFHIAGFWTAFGAALMISILSAFLNWFLKPNSLRVHVSRRRF
jgi:putative membrane protein